MVRSRRLTAAVAVLALAAAPSAALAQSAGDDQYEDPFADETPSEETAPAPASARGGTGGGDPEPPPMTADPGLGGDAPAGATQAPALTPGAQLPRTGPDAVLIALTGLGMVAAGAGLRLRLRDGARSA